MIGLGFTIITVTRNSGVKLIETCKSVACQNVDYEHLIIDGNSTDGSRDLAFELAKADSRIFVISEPDKGIYDAMNKGIRLAKGRYLYFLGAGDTVMPGAFSAVFKTIPHHDRAFIYGDAIRDGSRYDGPFSARKLIRKNICHQAIFYGKDIFKIIGTYDLRYPLLADWEMNMRCFASGRIPKIHVNVLIAHYEPDGVSNHVEDVPFNQDRQRLILQHLGWVPFFEFIRPKIRSHLIWRRKQLLAPFKKL